MKYKDQLNGGVSLLAFGFGESQSLLRHQDSSSSQSVCFGDVVLACTTQESKVDSCSQGLPTTPPVASLRRSTAMYQAVMAACIRVGRRLPTFEYADVVLELECVDWRANDETIHRYIRYLLEDGRLKRFARGVYSL